MKTILEEKNVFVLRFDSGEDVVAGLVNFCEENAISAGSFTALGAAVAATISWYDLLNKQYVDREVNGMWEIVSCAGNVTRVDGKLLVHTHGVLSDNTYQTLGGHFKRLIVSATCEATLHAFSGAIARDFDERTGLNLMR